MEKRMAVEKNLRITGAWAGESVLEVVRRAFPEISPREVFRKARSGEVRRQERVCHPLDRVEAGDLVTVVVQELPPPATVRPTREQEDVETTAGPFRIVREDRDLLVVSKPAGCASHPALKHSGDTLLDRVRAYLGVRPEDPFQPALANRLDVETSGIVLVGKNRPAQRRLGRHLQKGVPRKWYLVLVDGWPAADEGEIRAPLVRRPDSRDRARLPPGHPRLEARLQEAATRYRVVARLGHPFRTALLEVELLTGRTHQIRRHLADVGHPVAGDRRYGDPDFNRDLVRLAELPRMFLHARRVVLPHPRSHETLDLQAPLPSDLEPALRAFGLAEVHAVRAAQ